jgi:hypothetical protein
MYYYLTRQNEQKYFTYSICHCDFYFAQTCLHSLAFLSRKAFKYVL